MSSYSSGKSPRQASTQPLKDAMKDMFKAYRLQGKMNQVFVTSCWEKIMGPTIARYTRKLYFHDGKLYVELTSAPLKHELVMSKTKVIQCINDEVGEEVLTEVVFL
jgi:predicted nucleic acid-binding Zn ribbon protein